MDLLLGRRGDGGAAHTPFGNRLTTRYCCPESAFGDETRTPHNIHLRERDFLLVSHDANTPHKGPTQEKVGNLAYAVHPSDSGGIEQQPHPIYVCVLAPSPVWGLETTIAEACRSRSPQKPGRSPRKPSSPSVRALSLSLA